MSPLGPSVEGGKSGTHRPRGAFTLGTADDSRRAVGLDSQGGLRGAAPLPEGGDGRGDLDAKRAGTEGAILGAESGPVEGFGLTRGLKH